MSSIEASAHLTCDEVEALLPLVADGAITAADDAELFIHLAACPDCQADLALHDLTSLALGHGRPPVATVADDEAVRLIHLRWPTVAGSLALAAGLAVAVWFGLRADASSVSLEAIQPPATQVVEVTLDDEGNEVIVLMRDGERLEVRSIDQNDEHADGIGGSTPVSMPHR